jgi:hypothetical protein
MQSMYYIGLDVHKRIISYCVKDGSGTIYAEGTIPATRFDLDHWMKTLPGAPGSAFLPGCRRYGRGISSWFADGPNRPFFDFAMARDAAGCYLAISGLHRRSLFGPSRA